MRRSERHNHPRQNRAMYLDDTSSGGASVPYHASQYQAASPQPSYAQAPHVAEYDPLLDADGNEQPPRSFAPRSASAPKPQRSRNRRAAPIWGIMAFILGAVLIALIALCLNAYSAYQPFLNKVAALQTDAFIEGVYVDGIDIGGLTWAQAQQKLAADQAQSTQQLNMVITVDDTSFLLTQNEVPFERNTNAILETAYALGRTNSPLTLGTTTTPFEWRYQHRLVTAQNSAYLYTTITYDKANVRAFVDNIAAYVTVAPQDAMVATFDFNTQAFTFTNEVVGAALDTSALQNAIIERLDLRDFGASIQTYTTQILPSVTRVELMNTFVKISSYSTTTTADYNRNVNIYLAAQAVNGTVLNAGETFSFNETTGQRTTAKGYLEAAAIAGGTTTDEVGGGVCQVSSTLFNTAMMADLELVYRSPHTWPSSYVDPGRDATVNWPNLDFKFKNQRDTPIFIVCQFKQGNSMSSRATLTVDIYGVSLGAGMSVGLDTEMTFKQNPPAEPLYERNTSLPAGTQQVKRKARTGYEYNTYRVYYQNGVEVSRSLLCTSTYRMIQELIEYN